MLITKFENIKMNDDKTFSNFYIELSNIFNSCFHLGEGIPYSKVVREILRSLLETLEHKVTTIKESKKKMWTY